jgi:hypothetical protein
MFSNALTLSKASCNLSVMPHRTDTETRFLNPTEDEIKCADRVQVELLLIVDNGYADNSIVWWLNMVFAELVRLRGGGDSVAVKAPAVFSSV